jgi:hypothetical protein
MQRDRSRKDRDANPMIEMKKELNRDEKVKEGYRICDEDKHIRNTSPWIQEKGWKRALTV